MNLLSGVIWPLTSEPSCELDALQCLSTKEKQDGRRVVWAEKVSVASSVELVQTLTWLRLAGDLPWAFAFFQSWNRVKSHRCAEDI